MKQWTLLKSWSCIVGSMLLTLLLALGGEALWASRQRGKLTDERYRIVAIVQTGPVKEALKTAYLAELLDLSHDRPLSLYAFDVKEGERKLLACPLISAAKINKIKPGTLYIDYTVRKPIACLADYRNIALDAEGYLFPLQPFFSPKNLPEIYLGLPPFGEEGGGSFQKPLQSKHLRLSLEILQMLGDAPWREGMRIVRIDVSNAFAESIGQREVVILTEEELSQQGTVCLFPKLLRLSPRDVGGQLANFLSLRRAMLGDYKRQIANMTLQGPQVRFEQKIVDLRLPQTALVQK